MPLLYYWRRDNYYHDMDQGVSFHLNQANPLLHQIERGDSLWAFTRARDGGYALAAELVVRAKTLNSPSFHYGRYRVWGDLARSRYFRVDGQRGAEPVIRGLSCRSNSPVLGQSFQGAAAVRAISGADHQVLSAFAQSLPLEPRACLLPEEELEAVILAGPIPAVAQLLQVTPSGIAEFRREYLARQAPGRNQQLVEELQRLYGGRCQLCRWDPTDEYGHYLCQGHHIQWLSRGGDDILENMMLICPNHHVAIHRCDAPLDFADLTLDFGSHREAVILNIHLPVRV